MNSKKIIVSFSMLLSFGQANHCFGDTNQSKPIIIHSEKSYKQRLKHKNAIERQSHFIKYHSTHNGITLFYDQSKKFSNFISLTDNQLGRTYGVVNNNVTTLYDQNLNSLGLYIYLLKEKSGNNSIQVKGDKKRYENQWLDSLSSRLTEKSVSIFSLLLGQNNIDQGVSIKAGNIYFDTITDSDQVVITGQRIQLGDLVIADWWSNSGEIKGFSHKLGKISFYTFTMEDGEVISGSTLEIPELNLLENNMKGTNR